MSAFQEEGHTPKVHEKTTHPSKIMSFDRMNAMPQCLPDVLGPFPTSFRKHVCTKSAIHGKGLFTKAEILANVLVFLFKGCKQRIQNQRSGSTLMLAITSENLLRTDTDLCYVALVNHSCNPNCTFQNGKIRMATKKYQFCW